MFGPIQLQRIMRRHGRLAAAVAALMVAVALLATVLAVRMADSGHSGHGGGHDRDAVVWCVATGACVLAVVATAVAVRRLVQRPSWLLSAPLMPAMRFIPAPAYVLARAGPAPPPLLQVFRF